MAAARVRVTGAVQGVGFRPFCYREAVRRGLAGFVLNDLAGVQIHLEGSSQAISEFVNELETNPPTASRITEIKVAETEEQGLSKFKIIESEAGQASQALEVSADLATCEGCKREILDSEDRRYRYAFTNCTDCGPRYTIIRELPYDRPKTTMQEFRMCADCQQEYDNPLDRRFHAQPDACPVCGPEVVLFEASGRVLRCKDPIKETVRLLMSGKIVAVKGLGGYHLMCDAMDPESVARLRNRKRRPHKPLAVMCRDTEQARSLAVISREEELVLRAPAAPVLLLPWNPEVPRDVRAALAPLNPGAGIMLAYTPIHHLMFATILKGARLNPLIATSANRGDEPIIADEGELLEKLGDVFDAVLAHNREIANRIDDSVALVSSDSPSGSPRGEEVSSRGEIHLIRRARGFAPAPLETPFRFQPSLAVGAEMKGSFAVADGNRVWLSPHIGELSNRETMEFFEQTLGTYLRWFRVEPEVVVCDAHPDYLSTRWAERYAEDKGIRLYRVQHHHAHVASVMFEHEIEEEVIGLALDGTGYGPDGSIWGCELLHLTDRGVRFKRLGHLKPLPLVGGELAIRRPRRMAAGVIADLFGADKAIAMFGKDGEIAGKMLERENDVSRALRVVRASSAGRLFDAVAGLIGLVDEITFEAQAPVALESLCPSDLSGTTGYPFAINDDLILDPAPCFAAILEDMDKGSGLSAISGRFHLGFANALVDWLERAREMTGISTVVLSGGVFANRTLVRLLSTLACELVEKPISLHFPRLIPATDGGLAAGQLLAARALIEL
ncbi:carbamoyltransferase HypF [candidate division WOR-3 bacterium]|nr:carbamoyltransferase HypF [candidate division WOR-3 bacterium]